MSALLPLAALVLVVSLVALMLRLTGGAALMQHTNPSKKENP